MHYFPLFCRLQGREVFVVGGGEVAARKIRLLRRAGAKVRVLSPDLCEELQQLADAGELSWEEGLFNGTLPSGLALVVAATDADGVNAAVAAAAEAAGVWVNCVDDPEHSTAITPAIVDRSPLVVAISSSGAGPVYTRRLREKIEAELPPRLGGLLDWAARWRKPVREALPSGLQRLRIWESVFDGVLSNLVLAGKEAEADAAMQALLGAGAQEPPRGEVWLVGAGPGDPDLLTLKALRRMQQADVVVYDRLLGPAILELVRRDAERIDAGKRRSNHTLPQEDINALLVRLAREGKRVLRLKGGDPFVFGRGGEELAELMAAGIPFEVIPGISAANGAAAYAGIPLTHRDHAQSCIFVTGHPRADGALDLPWQTLAREGQTVVVYMGLTRLEELCAALREAGAPDERPAALVENASRADQRTLVGTLATLPEQARAADLQGPTLLIIGDVVRLRDSLSWRPEGSAA
ncbi:MAG: siroheme synthase CysG [Oceanococcaceae bacterium]